MAVSKKLPVITLFVGDDSPTLQFTLAKSDGSGAVDLTGSTVNCYLRVMGGTSNKFSGAATNASIIDATTGRADYTLPSGGIDDPGVYYGQVKITFPSGRVQHSQSFQATVLEAL